MFHPTFSNACVLFSVEQCLWNIGALCVCLVKCWCDRLLAMDRDAFKRKEKKTAARTNFR